MPKLRLPVRLAGAAVFGLSLLATRADAHRLDEYLEQTLIDLQPDRITLNVDLTPGVGVAGRVVPTLDTDHDGTLSASEQAAYAAQVQRDLSLSLDGVAPPLRLTEASHPTVASMIGGLGTIALTFEALTPAASTPSRTLRFANHHDPADASYLVNCLLPRASGMRVVSQTRTPDQASYEAVIEVPAPATRWRVGQPGVLVGLMVAAGVLGSAGFVAFRVRRKAAVGE